MSDEEKQDKQQPEDSTAGEAEAADVPEDKGAAGQPEEQPEAEKQGDAEQAEQVEATAAESEEAASEAGEDKATEAEGAAAESAEKPTAKTEEKKPAKKSGKRKKKDADAKGEKEEVPGAHLEPDVGPREEEEEDVFAKYAADEDAEAAEGAEAEAEIPEAEPTPTKETRKLGADARFMATGKRKSSVARVILRRGKGAIQVNGRSLEEAFPRVTLRQFIRQPLETSGYGETVDVSARIHGGGNSGQAGALRHGIARAIIEADSELRVPLKRRGFLTRDPRVKERRKAGLKKARKRPQFSKR